MTEPSFLVGEKVTIRSGPFEGFEGVVEGFDADAHKVVVAIALLGKVTPVDLEAGDVGDQSVPYGDVPPVPRCPYVDSIREQLLVDVPGADAVYRTEAIAQIGQHTTVWLARFGESYRVIGRCGGNDAYGFRLTPLYETPVDRPLSAHEWQEFQGLLDACRFWELPYDDGRRIPSGRKHYHWGLDGYENGRCHKVTRVTEDAVSDVSECCAYLRKLAPEAFCILGSVWAVPLKWQFG